ncbi:hypothetical protein [Devosia indica]
MYSWFFFILFFASFFPPKKKKKRKKKELKHKEILNIRACVCETQKKGKGKKKQEGGKKHTGVLGWVGKRRGGVAEEKRKGFEKKKKKKTNTAIDFCCTHMRVCVCYLKMHVCEKGVYCILHFPKEKSEKMYIIRGRREKESLEKTRKGRERKRERKKRKRGKGGGCSKGEGKISFSWYLLRKLD